MQVGTYLICELLIHKLHTCISPPMQKGFRSGKQGKLAEHQGWHGPSCSPEFKIKDSKAEFSIIFPYYPGRLKHTDWTQVVDFWVVTLSPGYYKPQMSQFAARIQTCLSRKASLKRDTSESVKTSGGKQI